MSDRDVRVGVAGLTHLGVVTAAAAASLGFEVTGFDADRARVDGLAAGVVPFDEPGLADLLDAHPIGLSTDPGALAACDVVYVAADVPTDDAGVSDLHAVDDLVGAVVGAIAPGAVLVVLSQVPPGYTRGVPWPTSQRFYQVETLIFGRAVDRALQPERFIVGCDDADTPLPEALVALLTAYGCPVLPMRYESAELSKQAINLFLVSSVTTANTLAGLCERLGADWTEIAPALRLDARIGPAAYLAPALGLAGGNLERDVATISQLAAEHGVVAPVLSAWIDDSRHRHGWPLRALRDELGSIGDETVIAVLGLAYKPDTSSVKNSAGVELVADLGGRCEVRVHDPAADPAIAAHLGAKPVTRALDACVGVDAVVIATAWSEYAEIDPSELAAVMRGRLVVDPHGVLDSSEATAAGLRHLVLGRAS